MLNAPAKHRLLLSLKSEAAMGLRSVRGEVFSRHVGPEIAVQSVQPSEENARGPHGAAAVSKPQSDVDQRDSDRTPILPLVFSKAAEMKSVAFDSPVMPTGKKSAALALLNDSEVKGCKKCRLSLTRTQTVFGEGDVDAKIFFIGEGPGESEDQTGRPFVGRAGQLLDKMIAAMGLSRSQVFIANIVKCRPPDNRLPAPDEVATCTPYLVQQLEMVRPQVIVTLGLPAVKYMLEDPKLTMGRTRGTWQAWRGIKLMPTYHPSYVLRVYTETNRQAVWSDLQMVMKEIGLATRSRG